MNLGKLQNFCLNFNGEFIGVYSYIILYSIHIFQTIHFYFILT